MVDIQAVRCLAEEVMNLDGSSVKVSGRSECEGHDELRVCLRSCCNKSRSEPCAVAISFW